MDNQSAIRANSDCLRKTANDEFCISLFHEGGPYHIEASPLIYRANQWTGFYMIWTSLLKELKANSLDFSLGFLYRYPREFF